MNPQRTSFGGFPGGSGVKNPPASAGDVFDPWSRRTPGAQRQAGQWVISTEPVL